MYYADLLNLLMNKAEEAFGKRKQGINIKGVQFDAAGPCIYFNNKDLTDITIYISNKCRGNFNFAAFQIAHEVIHCLCPNFITDVTYLEEGLATFFQTQVSNIQIESSATNYITARELVSKLLEFDSNIIKEAREIEPNISKISKDLLARFYGGDDEELLDIITSPFY